MHINFCPNHPDENIHFVYEGTVTEVDLSLKISWYAKLENGCLRISLLISPSLYMCSAFCIGANNCWLWVNLLTHSDLFSKSVLTETILHQLISLPYFYIHFKYPIIWEVNSCSKKTRIFWAFILYFKSFFYKVIKEYWINWFVWKSIHCGRFY